MSEIERCDWDTGTVGTGPRKCGRKARWHVVRKSEPGRRRPVCGIHARSVRAWHYGELEQLTADLAARIAKECTDEP